MCSLRFENNLLAIEGVRFASISKKTPLSKLSFAFVSLALPLLVHRVQRFLCSFKKKIKKSDPVMGAKLNFKTYLQNRFFKFFEPSL